MSSPSKQSMRSWAGGFFSTGILIALKQSTLRPEEIPRIGYIPIAISKFTQDKTMAQKFINFILSPHGKAIFQKYHYLMDIHEARQFTRPDTPIGGEYVLPKEWRSVKQ